MNFIKNDYRSCPSKILKYQTSLLVDELNLNRATRNTNEEPPIKEFDFVEAYHHFRKDHNIF